MLNCSELRTLLEHALETLSGSAQQQIDELTRQLGDGELIDELALELDRLVGVMTTNEWAQTCITPNEQTAILRLHGFLDVISGQANAGLWTQEALRSSPEWEEVRSLAKHALSAMRQPPQKFG